MPRGTEALVEPDILRWARDAAGLSVDEAAHSLQTHPEKVQAWEEGEEHPSMAQLRRMATTYRRLLSDFYLPKAPDEAPLPHDFRRMPGEVPIPMNPPVCNGMIAPRDSWMMPPPCNEMIPPGAPRLLALEVLSPYGGSVKPSWTACRERGGGSRRSTRCDERCGGGGPGWRPRRWGPQQRHARRTGEAER